MPLIQSSSKEAVGKNIAAERAANKPEKQAVAIALDVQRRNRKRGGKNMPWFMHAPSGAAHTGPIQSPVPGRTDHVPMDVPSGSYVIPADLVSGLGQGNTEAGFHVIQSMFPMPQMPYGTAPSRPQFATGGTVPIDAAGGEYVIPPEAIVAKFGDLNHGHRILDAWVKTQREHHVKTLKKLPGPAK